MSWWHPFLEWDGPPGIGKTPQSPLEIVKVKWPGHWVVMGGHIELGETIVDTVVREAKEEVGLDIKNIRYLTSIAFERDDGIPTIIVSLYANSDGSKIKLSPELAEYKWVNLKEAKKYDLIAGIYEELEMLDKVLKGEDTSEWKKTE